MPDDIQSESIEAIPRDMPECHQDNMDMDELEYWSKHGHEDAGKRLEILKKETSNSKVY